MLSLRQGRRVEREIDSVILGLQSSLPTRNATVSVYENFDAKIDSLQEAVLAYVEKAERLIALRFDIRRQIASYNESSGLNRLMNEEAKIKSLAKMINDANGPELTDNERVISNQRFGQVKRQHAEGTLAADHYGNVKDTVPVNAVFSKENHDALKNRAKLLNRRVLELVDEMAMLNASKILTISDDDLKFLETFEIVV